MNQSESSQDSSTSAKKRRTLSDSEDFQETNLEENSPAKPVKENKKLTPLEQQVKDLKSKHPDTLLMVECGYR